MNLPQTAKEFCGMIKNFQTKKVDIGKVNDEYFINVLAGGLLTDCLLYTSRPEKMPRSSLC